MSNTGSFNPRRRPSVAASSDSSDEEFEKFNQKN